MKSMDKMKMAQKSLLANNINFAIEGMCLCMTFWHSRSIDMPNVPVPDTAFSHRVDSDIFLIIKQLFLNTLSQ